MKFFNSIAAAAVIGASLLVTSCSSKPTLDRSIIEGYNQCVAAHEKAIGEQKAAEVAKNGYASGLTGLTSSNCKDKYGIPYHRDITDYRITN